MSKDDKSKKKPGFMKRLFSSKKLSVDEDLKENTNSNSGKKLQRNNTVDPAALSREEEVQAEKRKPAESKPKPSKPRPAGDGSTRPKANGAVARPKESRSKRDTKARRKRKHKDNSQVKVDLSKELEFPCTPEVVLEYHKKKPILNASEEWLIVELNEFECLLDSMSIIKIIGKASKFFEVEPDELWEEFFEWVDDIPAYDEVINYDIWQEFRDKKYPM